MCGVSHETFEKNSWGNWFPGKSPFFYLLDFKSFSDYSRMHKCLSPPQRLYSRFQFAFEKSLRMFVCKFRCSLQNSNVCFEVRSEYLRWLNSEQFDWLTYYGSQSEHAKLAYRKLSERTSKQTLELCNEHSELTNEHSKWFFKSELKSRVIPRK